MLTFILFLILIGVGYTLGSLCSAILISKLFSLPNPCTEGSKNPGATNVLRLAGKKYAAMVLIADMLKGFIPVLLAQALTDSPTLVGFTCLAAVVGHMYPVFFDFQGGKGVATALGGFLGINFVMGIVLIAIWLLVANFSRFASLASLAAIGIAPFFATAMLQNVEIFPPLLILALLVFYRHRENIKRLLDKKEPKISLKHHQLSDITDAILQNQKDPNEDKQAKNHKADNEKEKETKETKKPKNHKSE